MPIYEYRCDQCGTFEVTQRITEEPLKKCPTCNADVNRIISATSFVLKGSGWYATDYARKGKSEPSTDSSATPSSASSDGDSSSGVKASSESSSSSDKSTTAKPAD
jgi:putative FmdB family regulatory protein